jgi:hypothetical protein
VGIPKFAEVGIRLCNLTAYRSRGHSTPDKKRGSTSEFRLYRLLARIGPRLHLSVAGIAESGKRKPRHAPSQRTRVARDGRRPLRRPAAPSAAPHHRRRFCRTWRRLQRCSQSSVAPGVQPHRGNRPSSTRTRFSLQIKRRPHSRNAAANRNNAEDAQNAAMVWRRL